MRRRRPPVRGNVVARNGGPSRKSGSQQVEVVPRPGLSGHLDPRNQRLLTGQGSWPVNGHNRAGRRTTFAYDSGGRRINEKWIGTGSRTITSMAERVMN